MIGSGVIEEVRGRLDAVALIGERLRLRKTGARYVASCPFHDEREESFRLYPGDKRFLCIGCGARGDVFDFFAKLEGKPFPVVLRELGAKVGVAVERLEASPEEKRTRREWAAVLAACAAATTHWEKQLWGVEGERARQYLARRGVAEETVRSFRIGYAANEWHDLERTLAAARIPVAAQQAAGLVAVKEEPGKARRHYDRFRDRIMFPTEDLAGRIVGFGGRALGSGEKPKYLNGPETLVYKKADVLYGLRRARDAIRRTGRAILVEGYFDVLVLHQAGFEGTVGLSGMVLSPRHVELLRTSGCRELVLLFDGDEAGARAPAAIAPVLLQDGLPATVARLPATLQGECDPDAFVLHVGKASLDEVLAEGRPLTEFLIEEAVHRHGGAAAMEEKLAVLGDLMPLVLAAPQGLARSTFEKALARRLGVDIGPLREEVERVGLAAAAGGHR